MCRCVGLLNQSHSVLALPVSCNKADSLGENYRGVFEEHIRSTFNAAANSAEDPETSYDHGLNTNDGRS